MALIFAVRGDNLNARYSRGGKEPGLVSRYTSPTQIPNVVNTAETGMIGDHFIDLYNGGLGRQALSYSGRNLWDGQAFSILYRGALKLDSLGAFLSVMAIAPEGYGTAFRLWKNGVGAPTYTYCITDDGQETSGYQLVEASTSLNVYNDWVVTFTGTTAANGFKIYKDGTLLLQVTSPAAMPPAKDKNISQITIGMDPGVSVTATHLEEFVIWDEVIDPANVALTSGNGALNGAARTAFVDCPVFDGLEVVDPGVANVLNGTSYVLNGTSLVGEYDASANYSDPGVANVRLATAYKFGRATNNRTGTLDLPAASNVRLGVAYDNSTTVGTFTTPTSTDPGVGNVRLSTQYVINDSTLTGTLITPGTLVNSTATAGLNDVKEYIQTMMIAANTTTGTPIDLSHGLSNAKRVQTVWKIHPEMILPQASLFPLVTCYIDSKDIARMDIAKTQLASKRRAKIKVKIVGSLWNNNFATADEDPADEDINHLMENIELIMRGDPSLSGVVNWQLANGCRYYTSILDEQTHLRSGILDLDCEIFY